MDLSQAPNPNSTPSQTWKWSFVLSWGGQGVDMAAKGKVKPTIL